MAKLMTWGGQVEDLPPVESPGERLAASSAFGSAVVACIWVMTLVRPIESACFSWGATFENASAQHLRQQIRSGFPAISCGFCHEVNQDRYCGVNYLRVSRNLLVLLASNSGTVDCKLSLKTLWKRQSMIARTGPRSPH